MDEMRKALTPNPSSYGVSNSRRLDHAFGRKWTEPQQSIAKQSSGKSKKIQRNYWGSSIFSRPSKILKTPLKSSSCRMVDHRTGERSLETGWIAICQIAGLEEGATITFHGLQDLLTWHQWTFSCGAKSRARCTSGTTKIWTTWRLPLLQCSAASDHPKRHDPSHHD